MHNTHFRADLPERLNPLIKCLQQCVSIMEKGRESEIYAFAWYEEKKVKAVEASVNLSTTSTADKGIVLRIMCNGVQYEEASNQLDQATILLKATSLRAKVDQETPNTSVAPFKPNTWQAELEKDLPADISQQIPSNLSNQTPVHFSPQCQQDPNAVSLDTLTALAIQFRNEAMVLATKISESHSEYAKITNVQFLLRFRLITNIFVDRNKIMSQTLPMSLLSGSGVNSNGQMNRMSKGGQGTLELIELNETEILSIAETPQKLSTAEKLTPGRYKIITGPTLSGIIAHEAFGHTQEGDTWMKGRSIAKDLRSKNQKVGNDQATIVNNPAMYNMEGSKSGSNGTYYFDNEGQLARSQTILDKGFLSTPMTDLTSAVQLNVDRTANGKRESWRRPLMARQTNTYFTPGDKTLDELISLVDNGFLATKPNGGMEDPKGGSLTAGTGHFEEIKDGKLTGKLFIGPSGGHIELTDSVFDVLERIVGKSSVAHQEHTPEVSLGGCGKYHKELVDAGVGGPYILWSSINCG